MRAGIKSLLLKLRAAYEKKCAVYLNTDVFRNVFGQRELKEEKHESRTDSD